MKHEFVSVPCAIHSRTRWPWQVKAAEAEYGQRGKDLMQLLTEADAFLTEERRERRKNKRCVDIVV